MPRRFFAWTLAIALLGAGAAWASPLTWKLEWRETDFSKSAIDFDEIISGGPPKDGIPSIDEPTFVPATEDKTLGEKEPVIALSVNGEAKAYPLRILTWHEIVNDAVGGEPVTVTFCPLCNAGVAFKRTLDGRVLDFGTTGKLRRSDLVMYDRQTESWWQQYSGEAIVGEMTGKRLEMVPSRMESWERFKARFPKGKVLVPNDPGMRDYGANPYVGYDRAARPFLYDGETPKGIAPMERVVVVGEEAWSLTLLREKGTLKSGDLTLSWTPGQNSALDARTIAKGRDVGNVTATRDGEDVVHHVTFAFVFHAFQPGGRLRLE